MIQLYSQTGVHMAVMHSGRVSSTRQHDSALGVLQMERSQNSETPNFKVKGVVSGLYLKIHRKRITTTKDEFEAALFEEKVEENHFNSYNMVGHEHCKIVITARGTYRVKCLKAKNRSQKRRMSFLPRKAHLRLGHSGEPN